ncbi:MAG: TauD/TfdA dioxygenase family protein [Alphaproteobacteria bacterium]
MVGVLSSEGGFGAVIEDVDLSRRGGEAVLAAFFKHRVVVIPGQSLTPERFVDLAKVFGRAEPHIVSHLRHSDHPEILFLSNIFEADKPIGIFDGAAYWHTDMSYEEEPGASTMVYSLQVPDRGGETLFADMVGAYDQLPKARKHEIDGLTVLHHYGNRADLTESSRTSATPLTKDQTAQVHNVFHPLVMVHPVTGRRALYGVSGSSFGIVGMPDDEAHGLLNELTAHGTQEEFIYRHRYAVGDVVVWDNYATLHSASLIAPATGPTDARLLHRISVKGLPPNLPPTPQNG